ncbi:MAG TPA: hypothetical protein VD790_04715 [Thermoleophilaceae bacterium]|nr:hypothetical protein [Thermoleophilaceae bacterium]
MGGLYRNSTRVMGVLTCVLGVAMIAASIAAGGGPLAIGVVAGIAFVLVGAARIWMASQG